MHQHSKLSSWRQLYSVTKAKCGARAQHVDLVGQTTYKYKVYTGLFSLDSLDIAFTAGCP